MLLELLLLGADVEPPEDEPALSFSVSVVALGAVELELDPALGLEGGVDGVVDDALLLEPGAGALEVFPGSFLLQAASPKASATAIANVESLMFPPGLGTNTEASKVRTGV